MDSSVTARHTFSTLAPADNPPSHLCTCTDYTAESDHRRRGFVVKTGKARLYQNIMGLDDLLTVRDGVAAFEVDSAPDLPTTTQFVGRKVKTGRPVWSTPKLANLSVTGGP